MFFRKSKFKPEVFRGYETLDAAMAEKGSSFTDEVFETTMHLKGAITTSMVPMKVLTPVGDSLNEECCERPSKKKHVRTFEDDECEDDGS